MMSNAKPKCGKTADVFKPFDEILLPDPRQRSFMVITATGFRSRGLEDFHRILTNIELHAGVPDDVRISFDTARNLYLYSWFVYRFQATAEMQAYAALELAFRIRIKPRTREEAKKFRGLNACIAHALKNRWFIDSKVRVYQRLLKAMEHDIESSRGQPGFQDPRNLPPDAWVQRLKDSIPTLRNAMAHGQPHLMPGAIGTLEICCDLINQLFPAYPEKAAGAASKS